MSVDRARTGHDTFPAPGQVRFTLGIDDHDGGGLLRFTADSKVEVWLVASEQPVDAAGQEGLKFVVLPLAFPNYETARRHADALALITRLLGNAITEAATHADDPIPQRDDGHRHRVRFERFSRTIPFRATCELCMECLIEDVRAWAADRGLLGDAVGLHARQMLDAQGDTIKDAIEKAFNRDGGLGDG